VILAHIGGVPVEETLLSLAGGTGTGLLLAGAWVRHRFRRGPERTD
jgi:hypothetical protein